MSALQVNLTLLHNKDKLRVRHVEVTGWYCQVCTKNTAFTNPPLIPLTLKYEGSVVGKGVLYENFGKFWREIR